MRASRLVSTLLLLQTRGQMTADQLAEELEVSVRTVYRDIEALGAAGVPVYGEAGKHGGYRLVDGYRTRLTGLAAAEAESLFLIGIPSAAADLGLGAAMAAAQLKLLAALPDQLRAAAERLAERFHLDAPSWYSEGEDTPHLGTIAGAVWGQRRIVIHYQRWKHPQDVIATVDPLGLVLKAGQWYLVAKSAQHVRTYRVARVHTLEETAETFQPPAGFDLAAYWRASLENFDARRHMGDASVRLSPQAVAQLPHLVEPAVARIARESARPADDDGWTQVDIPFESFDQAAALILQLGAHAEVVAPHLLRQQIAATLNDLVDLYGSAQTSTSSGQRSPASRSSSGVGAPVVSWARLNDS
jgi:predicted DNA-binding transcriptional regulator YafY